MEAESLMLSGKRVLRGTGKHYKITVMTKTIEKAQLIKRYHTLAGKLKMSDEDKKALLLGFGVSSSKDLSSDELLELCRLLNGQLGNKLDQWRKRVMAAIYGYLQLTGRAANPEYVKAIATRSAGEYASFNKIPLSRLQTVYYFFLDKQNTLKHTGRLVSEDMDVMQMQN